MTRLKGGDCACRCGCCRPGRHRVPDGVVTPRQMQILSLSAIYMSDKEIAHHLGISVHTVKNHMSAAYRHLGVHRRAKAIALVEQSLKRSRET